MNTEEMAMEQPNGPKSERRVVEAEIRLPKLEELELPKIDMEPVKAVAEQVLLTGLGVSILIGRGLVKAAKAAYRAGSEAAEHPGPLTQALLGLVRREPDKAHPSATTEIKVRVPILPVDNYDQLTTDELFVRLASLSDDQLQVLREYELTHQARPQVLEAIDRYLTAE
ncbi:MAG: hypothetical protein GX552_01625 [Chloroflexi bacterium]|jgi:hypothetical protein|nr:hypothetical protein [Chloroflexota bacterium]